MHVCFGQFMFGQARARAQRARNASCTFGRRDRRLIVYTVPCACFAAASVSLARSEPNITLPE